ncbi:MAG TPA: protein kinase [Edaphobacter sp.]|nr:protein kinase [Edaphobacter sp.]
MNREPITMTPERWRRLKEIYEAARGEPRLKQAELVHSLARNDQELEAEAKSLLSADETAASFLQTPVIDLHGCLTNDEPVRSLTPGDVISRRFEILRFLNSGGMGEVYEAWDSELKERIALKTIRPYIASDAMIIERFKREVRQARGISHTNVCRVYDLASYERIPGQPIWFLTMELLEGPTLLEHLRGQGPLATSQALEIVEQMVAGLAAAHDLGIVHRDFKSSNVMLVNAGDGHTRAVITDFGLAFDISAPREGPPEPGGQGTPDYMAPEQRRSGEVGVLADQYALGVVICEMLTGTRSTRIDLPDMSSVELPHQHLEHRWADVIRRCLETRPEDRFANVREILTILSPPKQRISSRWQAGAFAALVVGAVSAAFFVANKGVSRLTGLQQLTSSTDFSESPSLSRDGKLVAYMSDREETSNVDVWVQQLPAGRLLRLTTDPLDDEDPSIAPDGSSVVFRSERSSGGIYFRSVDPNGGAERLLASRGRNPRFSPDGRNIAYWVGDPDVTIASGKLYVLSLSGGPSVRIASDFKDARLPLWSSDGRSILFSGCRAGQQPMPACSDWWITSLDGKKVHNTRALAHLIQEKIYPVGAIGAWHGNAVLFSGRKGVETSIWELKLPAKESGTIGQPEQLTSWDARDMNPSLAENGTVAYVRNAGALHVWRIDHAIHRGPAIDSKITSSAEIDICPYISHDGRWLVFSRRSGNQFDIWVRDTQSGNETDFLAMGRRIFSPIIDDSGQNVVFEARENELPSVFRARRGEPAKRLCTGCSHPTGWFDGNRAVLYREGMPSQIKMANLETGDTQTVLEGRGVSLGEASWSPESQYLLFTASKEGESKRVFAVQFPQSTGTASGKWIPVTSASQWSDKPRWSGDGKYIFYLSKRDGFSCIWGQHFDPRTGKTKGPPFAVQHYHRPGNSVGVITAQAFNLSVAGDAIYLNVGEQTSSIWTGLLKPKSRFPLLKSRP